jgi:alpha-L-fucosidase 2
MPYETVGNLLLTFPETQSVTHYRRDLDLDTAIAHVSYVADGVACNREVFCSASQNIIAVRLTADKPGRVSFTATMETPQKADVQSAGGDTLLMSGVNGDAHGVAGALKFQARVLVQADGGKDLRGGRECRDAPDCRRHQLQELSRRFRRSPGADGEMDQRGRRIKF